MKADIRKSIIKETLFLALLIITSAIILMLFPEKASSVTSTAKDYLVEMVLILPAILVLMGLFAVYVPDKLVIDHLGKSSGIKGMLIAISLGTLPTGPLYMAFPLASLWLKKGASISNVVAFLSAWACIKIPQEIVEFQFLGLRFMLLRLVLTIIFVMIMGLVIEKILAPRQDKVLR